MADLREVLDRIGAEFLNARHQGDEALTGHSLAHFIRNDARDAVLKAASAISSLSYKAKGSPGDRRWSHNPWVAVMDCRETDTVREGVYIVYVYSSDCKALYLTVGQGCTILYDHVGKKNAIRELRRRAEVMWNRATPYAHRLNNNSLDLRGSSWRPQLYEASAVCSVRYSTANLPSLQILQADLAEALDIYRRLVELGLWAAEDEVISDAEETQYSDTITEARVFSLHRRIERRGGNAKRVKRALGTTCMACGLNLGERYGPIADGYIEAHHLVPISSLTVGEPVTLDPRKDFAVLCPNCHRIIHRMTDLSDLDGLRKLLQSPKRNRG